MNFKKNEVIRFVSTVENLDKIDACVPKPAKHFIPDWFKQMPSSPELRTVKRCPSFPDYFSLGYVVPMWMDSIIKYDEESDRYDFLQSSTKHFLSWEIHSNPQFIDHASPYFNGERGSFVFKTGCPWRIITPKGWSVLQLPMFYHFNKNWSVLPGVIDTDVHHEINQQVVYYGNGEDVEIERGTPLALYIPFKRDSKLKFDLGPMTKKEKEDMNTKDLELRTKMIGGGVYRERRRNRS